MAIQSILTKWGWIHLNGFTRGNSIAFREATFAQQKCSFRNQTFAEQKLFFSPAFSCEEKAVGG
ncbi:MAG: hypothetical protein WC602_02975 [archaeon]